MSFDPSIETDDEPLDRSELVRLREERDQARRDRERAEQRLDSWLSSRDREPARREQEAPLGPPPDPVEDREAFQRWQMERDRRQTAELERRLEAQEARVTREVDSRTRMVGLWTLFQSKYPEHAKRESLASTAFNRVSQRDGLDRTDAEIATAVAKEMDNLVGHPIAQLGREPDRTIDLSAGDRNTPPKRRKRDEDEGDDVPATLAGSIFKVQQRLGIA